MLTRLIGVTTEEIDFAAQIIKEGGLIAFPTETVYGLGANALDGEAASKIYEAKGRPSDNPMIAHIAEKEDLAMLTDEISQDMRVLMEVFWPGPLTMVVKAKDVVPRVTTGGLDTVAVRMPSNQIARALIKASGVPIAAPSANLSGKPSPTTYRHVQDDLDGKINGIIIGEDCSVGIESTVVDMTSPIPMVLRPGIITVEELSAALNKEVLLDPALKENLEDDAHFMPKSPGMKYKHYAPKAEMIIYRGNKENVLLAVAEERAKRVEFGQSVETIIFSDIEPKEAARQFFARLRDCDKKGIDVILATAIEESGVGFAVMNRMFKSAGYNIVEV